MKKNYLYALVTVCVWATSAALTKALMSDLPNLQVLTVSSVFAVLYLLVTGLKKGIVHRAKAYTPKQYLHMAGLGFLGLFLYSALYFYGIAELTSQEACILNYLWPMMLVLFSCLILKEPMTVMKAVAMVCSFVGIVILSAGGSGNPEGNTVGGILACIGAAACYGLFSVLNKKAGYDQEVSMLVFWLITAVCAAALGLATEQWVPIHGTQWLGLLWLGAVTDGLAYLLWALALNGEENTAKIANLAYLTPFLSVLVSAAALGERITPRALIALVFIIGGILLQSLRKSTKNGEI